MAIPWKIIILQSSTVFRRIPCREFHDTQRAPWQSHGTLPVRPTSMHISKAWQSEITHAKQVAPVELMRHFSTRWCVSGASLCHCQHPAQNTRTTVQYMTCLNWPLNTTCLKVNFYNVNRKTVKMHRLHKNTVYFTVYFADMHVASNYLLFYVTLKMNVLQYN